MKCTLIRYKGGGYDGCFWEWNYAYFDSGGDFHDVFSSGRFALPEEQQVQDMLRNRGRDGDPELFDLDVMADCDHLNEINGSTVVAIAQWLESKLGYELLVQCDDCKQYVDLSDIELTDLRHEGGIIYSRHGKLCGKCTTKIPYATA